MAITRLVVLDSGHNEYVSGKEAPDKSMREWEFNDYMQRRLEKRLAELNISTFLTNPYPAKKDEIGLRKRAQLGNEYWAKVGKPKAIFLSLHANAYGNGFNSARGTETFHASNASKETEKFAGMLQEEVFKTMKSLDSNAKDRGVKVADHTVTYNSYLKAVLAEYAFYSNTADLKILKNNRNDLAEATVRAICRYFDVTYKAPGATSNSGSSNNTSTGSGTKYYRAVTSSNSVKSNAIDEQNALKKLGYDAFLEAFKDGNGKQWYRVIATSDTNKAATQKAIDNLKAKGYKDTRIMEFVKK